MINTPLSQAGAGYPISLQEYRKNLAKAQNASSKDEGGKDIFVLNNSQNTIRKNTASNNPVSSKNNFLKWLFEPAAVSQYQGAYTVPRRQNNLQMLLSVFITVVMFAFMIRYFSAISKMMGGNEGTKAKNIWQNLSQSKSLEELALPKGLREAADNIIYKMENLTQYLEKGGTGKNSILLYGPPGTGKTTFAKAIAKRCPDSEFALMDLSQVGDKYVGGTEANINKIAKEVCNYADMHPDKKIFVFIDEIDTCALEDMGSHDQQYHASVLNALKTCLSEKFAKRKNIITIAATNIDIDPSKESKNSAKILSKPIIDRFNEKIKVGNPTVEQFEQAIADYYKGKPKVAQCLQTSSSKEVKEIAQKLAQQNSSFRELESLYDIAAAVDKNSDFLTFENVMKALEQILEKEDKPKTQMGFRL